MYAIATPRIGSAGAIGTADHLEMGFAILSRIHKICGARKMGQASGPSWRFYWGFCPGSRRPRARDPLVVWAWDLVVIRLLCCGLPDPPVASFSLCDL